MARWLTVLVALLAQGMALMSPVCFVRCIGADGHECVELAGGSCHGCDCRSQERLPKVCAIVMCGHSHEDQDEHDAPTGWQDRCEHCPCQHAPLDLAPQVPSKSLISGEAVQALHFVSVFDVTQVVRTWDKVSFSVASGLRPQEWPQLAELATIVMRV